MASLMMFVTSSTKGVDLSFSLTNSFFIVLGLFAFVASAGKAKAISINLSSTVIVQSFAPLLPITLAFIFLGEAQYFSFTKTDGLLRLISLLLLPVSLLLLKSDELDKKNKTKTVWLLSVIMALVVHGLIIFFQKTF